MPALEETIRKHVLKNAYDYGKANPGAVVGKVIAENPECKEDMKSTMAAINKVIAEVSRLSKEDMEKEMSNFTYVKRKEAERVLKLPDAEEGKVTTRSPLSPQAIST